MRSALDTPLNPPAPDPIDQYLNLLGTVKQQMDVAVPRMQQGIDAILSGGTGSMIPNGIPKNLGTNAYDPSAVGRASFKPITNPASSGTQEYVNKLLGNMQQPGSIQQPDAIHSIRAWGIESGSSKQFNFDRYYNHPKFKELGWNPYIDNEAYYNTNSTWVDDFSRASSQWGQLAWLGFKQTGGNWDNLFSGDTSGDTKYAREMDRMMSIANSSRGGLGGFVTNMYANSAYTFGVVGEIIAEEVALWGATALTGGALGEAALLRSGQNAAKLGKLGKLFDTAGDVGRAGIDVTQASRSMGTAVNSVQDISQARKFWNGVGNFINPFDNVAETVKNMKTGANGFDKLTDLAKTQKTFGAFYRDMRGLNAALAESRLEGGMVQNKVFDDLIQKHIAENGKAPSAEEMKGMAAQAKEAGVKTTLANVPAIFFSNKIVFEKALGGFKPFRQITKGGLGEMVIDYSKKAAKKYQGFIDTKTMNPAKWFTPKYRKYVANQFRPSNIAKHGLRYMAANLTEGLQEIYQEGISKTMTDYYTETYGSPERAGSALFNAKLAGGFGEQMSGQGAETFLSGFLMGGLVQGPQKLLTETLPQKFDKLTASAEQKAKRAEYEAQKTKDQENLTNFLNDVAADPKKFYDPMYANIKAQKDFSEIMDRAEENGDKKEHEDAKQDSIFSHVQTLLDKGYIDLFTNQIESFQKMDDAELSQAFGYDKDSGNSDEYNKDIRSRLDSVLKKTNDIKARYDKYSSIRNPFDNESEDIMEQLDFFGFEEARKQAIYNEYTFDEAKGRMGSILNAVNTDPILSKIKAGNITNIFNEKQLNDELDTLKSEIATYKEGDAKQKKLAEDKQKVYDKLLRLRESMTNHSIERNKAKNAALNPEVAAEVKATVKTVEAVQEGSTVTYKPKSGLPIQGKVIKKTKTRVTIQYKTEDGTIKTKEVSVNAKSLTVIGAKESGQQELDFEGTDPASKSVDFFRGELRSDFEEYLKVLAEMSDDGVDPASLNVDFDRVFSYLEDYLELGQDARAASMNVNLLNDPLYFSEAAKQFSGAAKAAHAIAAKKLSEALDTYKKRMVGNELLRELYNNYNAFFNPSEIEALLKGERIPSVFYDAGTKKPIDENTGRYQDILTLLEEFEASNGFSLKGKVITQEEETGKVFDYTSDNDKRALRDFMKDLGLDPNAKLQKVSAKEVLNYIIKNRYGRPAMRELARRMLTAVKPDEEITISLTESKAFSYSESEGIVIDPRYSAVDFNTGRVAFEYSVLNPLIQKVVAEGLEDTAFALATDNLMDAVREYYEANKKDIKDGASHALFQTMLSSREEFLSTALTNPMANSALDHIPYKNLNTNLWSELLTKIRNFLAKILGIKQATKNTALNEAIGIVSNKVESKPILTGETTIQPITRSDKGYTQDTPVIDMPKDLQTLLQAEFAMFNQEQIQNNKPIIPKDQFNKWVRTNNRAASIISNYNKRNGLTPSQVDNPEEVKSTKTLGDYNILQYNDGLYEVVYAPTGEVLGQLIEEPEEVDKIIENHKKGVKAKTGVKKQFQGKIVYTTLGADLEEATKASPDVKSSTDLLKEVLEAEGIALDKPIDQIMAGLFKKNREEALAIYDQLWANMEALASSGMTIVTDIGRFANKADVVLITEDNEALTKVVGKERVPSIRNFELEAKKIMTTRGISVMTIKDSLADVLMGKAKATTYKDKFKGKVKESIENAKNLEELEDIKMNVTSLMAEDEGMTIDEYSELINKKMQELSSKIPTFEEVGKGDIVVMKDRKAYGRSGIVQVMYKNSTYNNMTVKPLNSDEVMEISADDFNKQVEYMYRTDSENIPVTVTVTPEEVQTSNENLDSATDINSDTAIEEDIAAAESKSAEERNNDFENSLGCE
jgi:hypothetical protein